MTGDTQRKLINDMEDRINELEQRLTYTATMLDHACDLMPENADKRCLRGVARVSKQIAERSGND